MSKRTSRLEAISKRVSKRTGNPSCQAGVRQEIPHVEPVLASTERRDDISLDPAPAGALTCENTRMGEPRFARQTAHTRFVPRDSQRITRASYRDHCADSEVAVSSLLASLTIASDLRRFVRRKRSLECSFPEPFPTRRRCSAEGQEKHHA